MAVYWGRKRTSYGAKEKKKNIRSTVRHSIHKFSPLRNTILAAYEGRDIIITSAFFVVLPSRATVVASVSAASLSVRKTHIGGNKLIQGRFCGHLTHAVLLSVKIPMSFCCLSIGVFINFRNFVSRNQLILEQTFRPRGYVYTGYFDCSWPF